jgi:ribosome-binding factor A
MNRVVVAALVALICWAPPTLAEKDIGIFETLLESSVSFSETTDAIESALAGSEAGLVLHASHVVRTPDDMHQAKVYVLTSPAYAEAAAGESARTISAQVLRVAVFTSGDEQKTFVNMANPVAHAMVFYADSAKYETPKYKDLIEASERAAAQIRELVANVPGKAVNYPAGPTRTAKKYRKFNGDGPAKMMAKWRNWQESQLLIEDGSAGDFEAIVKRVAAALAGGTVSDASDSTGWEVITQIRLRDDAVYIGLSNPYIEDKMIRINSRFRSEGKSELSPFPGVDHVSALPTEVLVVKDGRETQVLHYGQMWRMQLYFWDSGYRAFTANVGVPGTIANSIEDAVEAAR